MKRPRSGPEMWHVLARGARRLPIFRDDEDAETFLRAMFRASAKWAVPVHAYALMSNHFHLLVSASAQALGGFMKSMNQSYSRRHNRRHRLTGHLLEGPYSAFRQASPIWAVRTSIYIHRNPVAAGLCGNAADWKWSSCRAWLEEGEPPVSPGPVLRTVSKDPARARREYRKLLDGWNDGPKKKGTVPTAEEIWEEQARWVLEEVRRTAPAGRDPRGPAAWFARHSGVPLRAIARAYGYKSANYANVVVNRAESRMSEETREPSDLI